MKRKLILCTVAVLSFILPSVKASAQFAVIDAQNAANQIMSYIQDAENALTNMEGIANVFESLENVHSALAEMQDIYKQVSPIIRETKAVTDIAINYARIAEDWDRYFDYMKSLDGASYNEVKYSYYWGTRLLKNAAEDFEYARKLIASRSLNMDDYQRYSQLQQLSSHLAGIHRSFSGQLNRKQKAMESRAAMESATKGMRSIMR